MEVVILEDTITAIITVPTMAMVTVSVFILDTAITLVAITVLDTLDTIINFPHRGWQ